MNTSVVNSVTCVERGSCLLCHCDAQKLRYPTVDGTMNETWVHVGNTIVVRNPHPVVSADYLIEEQP